MVDILLVTFATGKLCAMFVISFLLLRKWFSAEKKFLTDIPFIMSTFFLIWGLAKIIDVYIYFNYTLEEANQAEGILYSLGELRAYLIVIESIPMWILAILIWFPNQKKKQLVIGTSIIVFNFILFLTANSYSQMLQRIPLILFPVIFLHMLTYGILHFQRRLPTINNKMLMIGFFIQIINSLLISVYRTPEPKPWGYTWLYELIELIIVIILGYGFLTPSKYAVIFEKQEKKK